ncbi:HET domain-containing protein [Fusarium sp. LHS14.1]|nr:HET domain-containing protein [Fusarium sp. LHS14.1]
MLALAPSGFQRSNVHSLPSIRQALEEGTKNKGCLVARWSDSLILAPKHAPYVALSYEHEEAKHHQMEQMNLIYHNAELTIIAAASSNVQYGLPGVGAGYRPRIPQQVVKIGNIEIVPTMRHPHSAIQKSEWSTRAWTFQEGILSRRRLVFTNDQMYFECDGMNCHESVTNVPKRNDNWSDLGYCQQIESSLDELHASHKREYNCTLRPGILGWNDKHRFGQPDRPGLHAAFVRFLEMIQAYSARELMRPSDAPKAFYGIVSKFDSIPDRTDQIWGIPFYCHEERTREETFVAGLAWNHKARAGYDLDGLPMPRDIFPTWSWMNWSGEVEYRELDLYKDRPLSAFNSAVASVVLEADDGELLTLSEYLEIPQSGINRSEAPKAVRLETWVFPPATVVVAESSHLTLLGDPASLHTSIIDFLFNPGLASLAQRGLEFETEWICIYLGSVENKRICLVVRSSCDDGWERVGLLFSWSDKVDEWCASNPRRHVRLI